MPKLPITPITIEEWDVEIKQHSLHLKFDSQLFYVEEMLEEKIPRVNRELMEILIFPDSKRAEVCHRLIESGEIENYYELENPILFSAKDRQLLDSEYQQELDYYTNKRAWLRDKLACCKKEMELRADSLVIRTPKGTPYFVDFDGGHDVDNDGTTANKGNGDGPWATLDKATSVLAAGDTCAVRRNMTQVVTQDLNFSNDGTILAPITLEGDYGNEWGDHTDLSGTETATFTWGSKTVTFGGDISGVLAAGDWIYASGDDNTLYAYEVAGISGGSNEVATLYLPYKGGQAGSGKTIINMHPAPIWNTAAGNYQSKLNGDEWWILRGVHLRGTDSLGALYHHAAQGGLFEDVILECNGSGDYCVYGNSITKIVLNKCRLYNAEYAIRSSSSGFTKVKNSYIDLNSVASNYLVHGYEGWILFEDCEAVGLVDIHNIAANLGCELTLRNVALTFSGTHVSTLYGDNSATWLLCEDYDATLGDNRIFNHASVDNDTPFMQSDAVTVHGSEASSIKVIPGDALNSAHELGAELIFKIPLYVTTDSKTYTVYFKSSGTGNWTADPTNVELWIETECWESGSTIRGITKSTGVCDFNGDDTNWLELTVVAQPSAAGLLYLRCWYAKPKEGGKSNIFYVSPLPGIA